MLSDELITAPAEAVVIPMGDVLDAAVSAATVLRAAGIRTQVYFENKKFKQKIGYADKSGIPFAVLIGENEAGEGKVAVKDMKSGEQQTLGAGEAAEYISAALQARRAAKLIRD